MYELKEVDVRLVLREGTSLYSTERLSDPKKVVQVMREAMKDFDREMVCVVNLDAKMRPINYHVVSIGDINASVVPVRNVFKTAILSNAVGIMLLHNHPSGDISPSREDRDVTRRVIKAGKLMDIPLIDHVIIGAINGKIYSFEEEDPELFEGE